MRTSSISRDSLAPLTLLRGLPFQEKIDPGLSATLDKCRWLAAFMVLLYHVRLNVVFDPDTQALATLPWSQAVFFAMTTLGAQAVMWFFVISGFLVGGKVVTDLRHGRFSFGSYALDRISRIYVVLLPALAIGFGLDELRVHWYGLSALAGEETAASHSLWAFIGNLFGLQTILVPTLGSNLPLWSLAFEIWYYIAFPLLMAPFLTTSRKNRVLLTLLGVACLAFLATNPRILRSFMFWLLGVAIRFCPRPLVRPRGLAWMLAAVATLIYDPVFERFGAVMNLPVVLAFANALLTEMHLPQEKPAAPIHARLAGFSFSLYLVHAPFGHFLLCTIYGRKDPPLNFPLQGWAPIAWALALLALSLAYAWLFSRLTEAHTATVRSALRRVFGARRTAPSPDAMAAATPSEHVQR